MYLMPCDGCGLFEDPLRRRRRLRQCRSGVNGVMCCGMTYMRLAASRVVVLVVVMVVVEALRQGLGTECIRRGDRTFETAQHQLGVLLDLTLCGMGVHRSFHGTAGVERKVVVERLATNQREVDPDIAFVDRIN
jgi:hypothetical protein